MTENENAAPENLKNYRGKLYKQRGVLVATLIGGPIAAAITISSNFYVLGQMRRAILTWLFTIIFIFGLGIIDDLINVSSNFIFTFLSLLLAIGVVNKFQMPAIDEFIASGNLPHSNWKAALIGLIAFVLVITLYGLISG